MLPDVPPSVNVTDLTSSLVLLTQLFVPAPVAHLPLLMIPTLAVHLFEVDEPDPHTIEMELILPLVPLSVK